jgi:hypothetical protein
MMLILWAGLGAYCTWYVVRGMIAGRIKFIAGMVSPEFNRSDSPVGYWLSVVWDSLLTSIIVLSSIVLVWSALR